MTNSTEREGCFWYIVAFLGLALMLFRSPRKAWQLLKQLFTEILT